MEKIQINNVKEFSFDEKVISYILNNEMMVPKADGNREYELIKEWLAKGNTPEPEFTEEEIAQQVKNKQIADAKAYLSSTDYKFTADYDKDTTEVKAKRAEARAIIRALENN